MNGLEPFIIRAKAACYVGAGRRVRASRTASHDLTFADGAWRYRDSYFGGTDFLGQETVWHAAKPVWAMNYYGFILRDDLITAADTARIIRTALSAMYAEGRFLGGFQYRIGDDLYHDESTDNLQRFTGTERIDRGGVTVYQLHYHGGMVRA
jgi:Domain of unknown function (DUF5680)